MQLNNQPIVPDTANQVGDAQVLTNATDQEPKKPPEVLEGAQADRVEAMASSGTLNDTDLQRFTLLKQTLNLLHLEIHNLTQGMTTESELEKLNYDGKVGGFGGQVGDKSTQLDQGNERSGEEDGYEEPQGSGSAGAAENKVPEPLTQPLRQEAVMSWEEASEKLLQTIPLKKRILWTSPPSEGFSKCIQRSETHKIPAQNRTNGYLMVTANGGLNQMRAAICDMVAVTRIMNATLVIPGLDHTSYWNDTSEFEDIFDVDHFIETLKKDIRVVKQLPEPYADKKPYLKVPISWSPAKYYRSEVLPKLKKAKVIYFPLTDARLANNDIAQSIQRVRCRANYRALKHTKPIEQVSNNLVSRLRSKGPYIGLHLRYEKDMLAFTGCSHGLQPHEAESLRAMRLRNARWKEKDIDSNKRRREGLCPLTPRETALFLRALGYPSQTVIYIAAGEMYGSAGLKDLLELFPRTYTHSSLASPEELSSLGGFQNRHAAVDYEVAFQSNVFVATFEGNMAKAVQGHRRFEGHRRTLLPDRRAIVDLVDRYDSGKVDWPKFREDMKVAHYKRDGSPQVRVRGSHPKLEENFFANPMPGCICEHKEKKGH